MYFDFFPAGYFEISKNEKIVVTDIIRAVQFTRGIKDSTGLFLPPYLAMDDETPELISLKHYDTVAYGWMIMILNDRFDPYNDFPKSDRILLEYTAMKYGNTNGVHHYIGSDGAIVDVFSGGTPVTNYEYEVAENEKKRELLILRPELISYFVKQYRDAANA